TGLVAVERESQSRSPGPFDYLTKPFNLAELRITLERALEKRRLIRENQEYQRTLESRGAARTVQLVRKEHEVEELLGRLQSSYQTTLEALATALDTRDTETLGHSLRVASY